MPTSSAPFADNASGALSSLGERLRDVPGVDVILSLPRTWRFIANALHSQVRPDEDAEIPRPLPTLGLVGCVFIDELMGALLRTTRLSPSHEDVWRTSKEVEQALAWLAHVGAVGDVERFHRSPPRLERPLIETKRWGWRNYEQMSFHSVYEPRRGMPARERWQAFEANRIARAYVLRHPGEPRPWLMNLHGFGMGYPRDLAGFRSWHFHQELGLNVIHPVFPLHGPRKQGRISGQGVISLEFIHNLYGLSQAIWDVRRCLSWVRSQGAPSIALHGVSLGGYTAGIVAGLEPDLDCVIAGIPPSDLPRSMVDHAPRSIRKLAKDEKLFGDNAHRLHALVSPLTLKPQTPSERLFIYAGVADRMATPQQALALWRHWGEPRIEWFRGSHVSYIWSRDVWQFVEDALVDSGFAEQPAGAA